MKSTKQIYCYAAYMQKTAQHHCLRLDGQEMWHCMTPRQTQAYTFCSMRWWLCCTQMVLVFAATAAATTAVVVTVSMTFPFGLFCGIAFAAVVVVVVAMCLHSTQPLTLILALVLLLFFLLFLLYVDYVVGFVMAIM